VRPTYTPNAHRRHRIYRCERAGNTRERPANAWPHSALVSGNEIDDELVIGRDPVRRGSQWLWIGISLIAGLLLGRLSASHSTSATAPSPTAPEQRNTAVTEPAVGARDARGCPTTRTCTSHEIAAPLLLELLRLDFADVRTSSIAATDDTVTGDHHQVQLVATLARGLTLRITAHDAATRAVPTSWTFVAIGERRRPEHAERTMTSANAPGLVVHATIAINDDVHRPGVSDMRCDWCQQPVHNAVTPPNLRPLFSAKNGLIAMIAIALRAASDSHVLDWFG
jgi:hypothetical protein